MKENKRPVNKWIIIGLVAAIVIALFTLKPNSDERPKRSTNETLLKDATSYLAQREDVKWIEYQGNEIYIGFYPFPADYSYICNHAAEIGNKAMDFGCRVYAYDASKHRSLIGNTHDYTYMTAWRYGQKEDSDTR